jgi:hypothetical protein
MMMMMMMMMMFWVLMPRRLVSNCQFSEKHSAVSPYGAKIQIIPRLYNINIKCYSSHGTISLRSWILTVNEAPQEE